MRVLVMILLSFATLSAGAVSFALHLTALARRTPRGPVAAGTIGPASPSRGGATTLPPQFQANRGQAPRETLFVTRRAGTDMRVTRTGARFLGVLPLSLQFVGAFPGSQVCAEDPSPALAAAPRGDTSLQAAEVAQYSRLRYREVYRGIDAVVDSTPDGFEYDFVVLPGIDPRSIRVRFSLGTRLQFDTHGNLIIETPRGISRQSPPVAFQDDGAGGRLPVVVRYHLIGDRTLAVTVGAYDHTSTLIIDRFLRLGSPEETQSLAAGIVPAR